MAEYKLIMPKMGESIAEATIISWLKNEGDAIDVDEAVLEIATDKVDSEVPSMEAGSLIKRLYNEGDVVKVGEAIAIINTSGDSNQPDISEEEPAPAIQTIEKTIEVAKEIVTTEAIIKNGTNNKFYSPLVMNIAKTEGISAAQLETIQGTGQDGRVTKKDILSFIESGQSMLA
jgi:2-oxoglutarate dehydrogenase E2 component (dihydrolipoamide succinyltransferase)